MSLSLLKLQQGTLNQPKGKNEIVNKGLKNEAEKFLCYPVVKSYLKFSIELEVQGERQWMK